MGRGIMPPSIGEESQHRKNDYVEHRHRVERPHVERTDHLNPRHRIRRRHHSDDDHSACQPKAEQPELPAKIEAVRGNQTGLRSQEQNPTGEKDRMYVNQIVRQRRPYHANKKIRLRESNEHSRFRLQFFPRPALECFRVLRMAEEVLQLRS